MTSWRLVTALCLVACSSADRCFGTAGLPGGDSGIELVGASPDSSSLQYWDVYDAKDPGKSLVRVSDRWGMTPLPPGEYVIKLTPGDLGRDEVTWGTVKVEEGKVTTVRIDSGIELTGAAPDSPPLQYWYVYDAKDREKRLTYVVTRWGMTPLPPGEYVVKLTPGDLGRDEITWKTVRVEAGKVTHVRIDSGIELTGAAPDSPPLQYWYVYDAKDSEKRLTYVVTRWGMTPLPPGEYVVKLTPGDLGRDEITWSTIKVEEGKVAKVSIDSGVELVGSSPDSPPLLYWYVYNSSDPKARITYVGSHWGKTPLPPGKYDIRITPGDFGKRPIPWGSVTVEAGKVSTLKVDSGIELVSPAPDSPPLRYWYVYDTRDTKNELTYVDGGWGTTPLVPGEYLIKVSPGTDSAQIPWANVKVEAGKVSRLTLDSGVVLAGKTNDSPPPKSLTVECDGTEFRTPGEQRWGPVFLPPGDYRILLEPSTPDQSLVRGRKVNVKAGEFITFNAELTLPERLALVSGFGLKTEKEVDPDGYRKLEEEIERAIRRGAHWLKTENAHFLDTQLDDMNSTYPTIGILALVHAGELDRDSELATRCIDYLLRRRLHGSSATYTTALTAMALRDIDAYRYRNRIFECARWLVENQGWDTEKANEVWGYGREVPGIGETKSAEKSDRKLPERPRIVRGMKELVREVVRKGSVREPESGWDNSNAQFAVLGLHSSANSGIGIPSESWEHIERHFRRVQCSDGSWDYHGPGGSGYGSMTCAGLASLIIARHHLGVEQPLLDSAVVGGLEWLEAAFTVEENPDYASDHLYFLYGLERAGILAGTEFYGSNEWYPVGARYLLAEQQESGAWSSTQGPPTGTDREYLDTCYAILFLRRATLPLTPEKPAFLAVTSEKGKLPSALMPAVEVILDCSGSMKELVGTEPKMRIAQKVMTEAMDRLPETIQLGLRLYGHRSGNAAKPPVSALDPVARTNTELVLAIAPLTSARRDEIRKRVNSAEPWGWTPMVYSVLQAKKDFSQGGSTSRTVVLVSDGAETCGGKLEDIAKTYKDSNIGVVIHVVGFDVEKDPAAKQQLLEIARLGSGEYFSASDAKGLGTALDQAVGNIEFIVSDPATGHQITRGSINEEPVALKPGKYQIQVSGLDSEPVPIEIVDDQLLELSLDEKGQLVPVDQAAP